MNSRIVVDEATGMNVDECLETCFMQVFEQLTDGEEGAAIEKILNEYTSQVFGPDGVTTQGIITDISKAIQWALQFGELRIHNLSSKYIRELRDSSADYPADIAFGAKIGPDNVEQKSVCGSTLHQVVLLAAIQVLRETSYGILNSDGTETSH